MDAINTTDHPNFQFGLFCLPNHHSNTYKLLQNSPFFWNTLYLSNAVVVMLWSTSQVSVVWLVSVKTLRSLPGNIVRSLTKDKQVDRINQWEPVFGINWLITGVEIVNVKIPFLDCHRVTHKGRPSFSFYCH